MYIYICILLLLILSFTWIPCLAGRSGMPTWGVAAVGRGSYGGNSLRLGRAWEPSSRVSSGEFIVQLP